MAGALYFSAIAIVHFLGLKVPGLFVYYNIPSYPYQDTIIAFLAFGWALFFYSAARHTVMADAVLLAALVALAGMAKINLSSSFPAQAADVSVLPFWIEYGLLVCYVSWLGFLHRRIRIQAVNDQP
jgi:hypothetical protein